MKENNEFIWDDENIEEIDEKTLLGFEEDDINEFEEFYQKEKKKKRKTQIKKIVIIIILCLLISLFLPIFLIKNININETNFIKSEQITNIIKNKNVSIIDFVLLEQKIKKEIQCDVNINYDFKNNILNIHVDEPKPLFKYEDIYYYLEKNQIKTTIENKYYAPTLKDFNEELKNKLLNEIKGLDYNIIKEINMIVNISNQTEPSLVLFLMKDGNYVLINQEQISKKMKYYNQMTNIVKQVKGEDAKGIFHLDYGDYYEQL